MFLFVILPIYTHLRAVNSPQLRPIQHKYDEEKKSNSVLYLNKWNILSNAAIKCNIYTRTYKCINLDFVFHIFYECHYAIDIHESVSLHIISTRLLLHKISVMDGHEQHV